MGIFLGTIRTTLYVEIIGVTLLLHGLHRGLVSGRLLHGSALHLLDGLQGSGGRLDVDLLGKFKFGYGVIDGS